MREWKLGDWAWIMVVLLLVLGGLTGVVLVLNGERADETTRVNQERHTEALRIDRQRAAEARHNAVILYENALRGCQRNNKPRRVLYRFASVAAKARAYEAQTSTGEKRAVAAHAARSFKASAEELAHQEHARPDGSIICHDAVTKPPPGRPVEDNVYPSLIVPADTLTAVVNQRP